MGKWVKGQSGNTSGRPVGIPSRGVLIKTKIFDLFDKYEKEFMVALEKEIKRDPIAFYHIFMTPFMQNKIEIESNINIGAGVLSKDEMLDRLNIVEGGLKHAERPINKIGESKESDIL